MFALSLSLSLYLSIYLSLFFVCRRTPQRSPPSIAAKACQLPRQSNHLASKMNRYKMIPNTQSRRSTMIPTLKKLTMIQHQKMTSQMMSPWPRHCHLHPKLQVLSRPLVVDRCWKRRIQPRHPPPPAPLPLSLRPPSSPLQTLPLPLPSRPLSSSLTLKAATRASCTNRSRGRSQSARSAQKPKRARNNDRSGSLVSMMGATNTFAVASHPSAP